MKVFYRIAILLSFIWCQNIKILAQNPNLGSAQSFVIFTGVGDFNVTGAANVTGDVGTDFGTFVGFPPGILTGQKYVSDASSAQAMIDVGLVYADLATRTCTTNIGVGMGTGQILTPGVYCTGGAATLDGLLIFDAQNISNALFIIQIDGAFASTSTASISLINGASSCNIYWQVNGMFTLEDESDFKGTALVTGAVSLLGNAVLEGRVLVTSGAINMDANIVVPCDMLLPMQLISFEAKLSQNSDKVILGWQTASEINSSHFIIEKSSDGLDFTPIGQINAMGNSQSLASYTFYDDFPCDSFNYYRLNQFDIDGNHMYSYTRMVYYTVTIIDVVIFPNPFSNEITIKTNGEKGNNNMNLSLYQPNGQKVSDITFSEMVFTFKTNHLIPGQYFYIITKDKKRIKTGTLVSL
ncbi:MAG: DUF3494 domain-containing protein [Saprospiraceae bacterium]|jgi:hypothetical protein|nr:DUF3494 domain-containing protein [Saprospiraceae bacterium]MBP6567111.1 DUF3494 domain-containing protein [Saprospiraceae bacterium]